MQPWRQIQSIPVPWVLSTAGNCSEICAGATSCLIIILLFNVLFLWYFLSLSTVDLLICALKLSALIFLSLQDKSPNADWLQVCFGTRSDTVVKSVFQKSLSVTLRMKCLLKIYCNVIPISGSQFQSSLLGLENDGMAAHIHSAYPWWPCKQ